MRLLIRPSPDPLEGLPEFFLRLADRNGVSSVAYISGQDIARPISTKVLQELCEISGQPASVIGELGPGRWTHGGNSKWRGWRASSQWLLGRYARLCPVCLRATRVRHHAWRYRYALCCVSHRVRLVERCPQCAEPIDLFAGTATRCGCGFHLAESPTTPASDELIAAQKTLIGGCVPGDFAAPEVSHAMSAEVLAILRRLRFGDAKVDERRVEIAETLAIDALHLIRMPEQAYFRVCELLSTAAVEMLTEAAMTPQQRAAVRLINWSARQPVDSPARFIWEQWCSARRGSVVRFWRADPARRRTTKHLIEGFTPIEAARQVGLHYQTFFRLMKRGVIPCDRVDIGAKAPYPVISKQVVSELLKVRARHMDLAELMSTLAIDRAQARSLLAKGVLREWRLSSTGGLSSLVPVEDVARLLARLDAMAQPVPDQLLERSDVGLVSLNQARAGLYAIDNSLGGLLLEIIRRQRPLYRIEGLGIGLDRFAVLADRAGRVAAMSRKSDSSYQSVSNEALATA